MFMNISMYICDEIIVNENRGHEFEIEQGLYDIWEELERGKGRTEMM